VLRKVGVAECFTEPRALYDKALAAGMDFVTIADHDRIEGALELASLPRTFMSVEVTTWFPENDAKVHIVVNGITEEQFRGIEATRADIVTLRDYLHTERLIATVAHPFFRVNDRLTVAQFEKLLVLFNRFEVINGTRSMRDANALRAVLESLRADDIERMAGRHGLSFWGPTPQQKLLTGGSDDHSGHYVACVHTVTPAAKTVAEYLGFLREGRHEPGGRAGTSVRLAHGFYHVAYDYYKTRILNNVDSKLMREVFERLLRPRPPKRRSWIYSAVRSWFIRRKVRTLSSTERMIVREVSGLIETERKADLGDDLSMYTFRTSCRLAHELSHTFVRNALGRFLRGDLFRSFEALSAVVPVLAAVAPYVFSFRTQNKDEPFLREIVEKFPRASKHLRRSDQVGWITDTFNDINGVAHTIANVGEAALRAGYGVQIMTCLPEHPRGSFRLKNFAPVGVFEIPEYPEMKLSFPPFLEVLEHIERAELDELIISTPGPMGLLGLLAARLLRLRTVGIYHTDVPRYVGALTKDEGFERMAWGAMEWFYGKFDRVLVPSARYREILCEHGLERSRISVLRRGIGPGFGKESRGPSFWRRYGGRECFTFLYVGRISSEKNIKLLLDAWLLTRAKAKTTQLAVVGDGPELASLKRRYAGRGVVFTGYLRGQDLKTAYASADVFVFPSLTDTFGNVVLEAKASGLPAIVSDAGGPQEIVEHEKTGLVVELSGASDSAERFSRAMTRLFEDQVLRIGMKVACADAEVPSWPEVADELFGAVVQATQRAAK
jgi:glycosyltransferase involved in cell wall biosynthesis